MLHELIPKQERLRKLKEMHSKLEQIGEGKNVPLSLDDMRLQFEEIKTKQAALFERRETEEEAEELIGDVRQDIERARETLKYEIECEAEKETAQIKRLEVRQFLLDDSVLKQTLPYFQASYYKYC